MRYTLRSVAAWCTRVSGGWFETRLCLKRKSSKEYVVGRAGPEPWFRDADNEINLEDGANFLTALNNQNLVAQLCRYYSELGILCITLWSC